MGYFLLLLNCFVSCNHISLHFKVPYRPTDWPTEILLVFTARAYPIVVLGVVILSVRPSVRPSVCLSHAWIVTKLNDALRIF